MGIVVATVVVVVEGAGISEKKKMFYWVTVIKWIPYYKNCSIPYSFHLSYPKSFLFLSLVKFIISIYT